MNDTTSIGVVGAGATGAYLAARLIEAGYAVTLVARGASLERIRAKGIEVRNSDGSRFTAHPKAVVAEGEVTDPVDFTLFNVKGYDTTSAVAALDPLLRNDGHVVCLQNGVKNELVLADRFGAPRVISGVLYIGSERLEPGVVTCSSPPRIVIGPFEGEDLEPASQLEAVFKAAGIETRVTAEVVREKWQKFLFNCGLNPLTALTGMKMGALLEMPETANVFDAFVNEALAVALAAGAPLTPEAKDDVMDVARRMDISSSMAEDLKAGRALELDAFTGYVVELGERYGVPTPATEVAHGVLTALNDQRQEA